MDKDEKVQMTWAPELVVPGAAVHKVNVDQLLLQLKLSRLRITIAARLIFSERPMKDVQAER